MIFLIQPTKLEETQINTLFNLLDVAHIAYKKVFPLNGKILNPDKTEFLFEDSEKYFVIGSYPLIRYINKIRPDAVFSLDNFNFENWYSIFGNQNMLNSQPQICLSKEIDWISEELFVRPLEDDKSFNGGIYNKNTLLFEGMCVAAPVQQIQKEFRFFVLNNEIIGQSQYKQNGDFFVSSLVDENAIKFANKMINKFNFKAYTIDIAYINNTYKIVELNCFNASGFYSINLFNFLNKIIYDVTLI